MKQINMHINKCPLCEHREFRKKLITKDYSLTQEEFTIVECVGCGFLYTNPRPSEENIGEYYKSSNYISHTNQSSGLFGFVYQFLRNRALTLKRSWIEKYAKPAKLLDYGSGTGEFLNYMQEHGWSVKGVEIADGPRVKSQSKYRIEVLKPEELRSEPNTTYDVVTMWHVLEHIDDLINSVSQILSKLKPGGHLILALPNPESYDAKVYKGFWAAWDVPIHFYHFKKKDVELLAAKTGLELVKTINMPFDSFYVSLLSEQYKRGRKSWFRAVWVGFLSNLKAQKNNASSLTYVLRKK